MKKFLMFLCTLTLVLGFVGSSMATPINVDIDGGPDSYVKLLSQNTGVDILFWTFGADTSLTATLNDGLGDMPSWTLADNESTTVDFFDFAVTGSGVGDFDLEANLSFSSPDFDATSTGDGGWGTVSWDFWDFWRINHFKGSFSGGVFDWDQDTFLTTLSDGNIMQVVLEDGFAIGCDNTTTVHATITNLGGAAPVPEPATLFLLGSGLLGLAGFRRKKSMK